MFGLDPDTERNIKQAFAEIPVIDKVILYGSRAKGNYRNGSDIDITLFGDKLTLSNSVYPLTDGLEDLNLPYMFDISIFSHIDNEDLIEHIHRAGKILYLKEKGLPKGDALSLPKGDALSLPKGDALSLPKGDALSLPKGWEVKKLGEVCDVRDGTHDSPKYINKGFALITSKNLKNDTLNYDKVKYISEEDYTNINKRSKVDVGDILFAMIGTIGNPVVIKNKPCFAIKNVALFKVPKDQDSYFFKYYLDSQYVIQKMQKDAKGATQRFVGLGYLRNFRIPLPPLPEQKRIVAILDQAFTAIDQAKANTEKNLKNARELFQSKLQETFANGKLKIESGEWEEKTLEEIALVFGRGKSRHRPRNQKELYDGKYPFIQTGSVRNANKFITKYSQTYSEVGLAQSKLWRKGTICITIAANIAETAILKFDACFPDSIIGLEVNSKKANLDFTYYALQYLKTELQKKGKGTAQDNINLGTFEKQDFPFPKSLKEQKSIVKQLDAVSTETKKLEAIYQRKITCLDELKKSILQKAFNGEL